LKSFIYISLFILGGFSTTYASSDGRKDTIPEIADSLEILPYQMFKSRFIIYADLGFRTAPFSISDNYGMGVEKLKYRNNFKVVLGIGFSYRWLSLRVGFSLPGNTLSAAKYTNTEYFDIGLKFNIKQAYCSIDLRNYLGYGIKDAYKWNDSLDLQTPNQLMHSVRSVNISANVWFFKDKKFNMRAALGKKGHFTGESKTWYFKGILNFFGTGNDHGSLVPQNLTDSISDRQNANTVGALEVGFVPGYVYANRINNWQFSIFAGLGGVIQSKYYTRGDKSKSHLGIAPRFDFRLIGGYSKPGFFVLLTGTMDYYSLQIEQLSYHQFYYDVKLVSGFRIQTKRSKKEEGFL